MVTKTSNDLQHKFVHDQYVDIIMVDGEKPITMRVLAILPHKCQTHNSPMYGCSDGCTHFYTCEKIMQPLPTEKKRKLN